MFSHWISEDRQSSTLTTHAIALLIGFDQEDRVELGMPFSVARCERMPFALLHAGLASAPWTDLVVSPLVGPGFDTMDLAYQLSLGGYRGRYMVVTPALPRPEIIRSEIAQLCPGLQVELIRRARH
ncbi:hypothetical protein [Rhodovulum adriaticum]|uniref:Uncharacterized protein n=1 Tax=Rhodovulum adriaticum TaxID=35804 RepID=A0A4R2NP66_RHOAD|nr:hypothetical protein [Rhodovulum adriaticum]MBK1634410.1 hypothetical protein [Rhodovulum adriaticum]TCP23221.1 hypothetical protein EV656_104196 [Rhodovulum adriaticum]